MAGEIQVSLHWLPMNASGNLLVHRHIVPSQGGSGLDEFWISDVIGELAVAVPDVVSTDGWQRILSGLPVKTFSIETVVARVQLVLVDPGRLESTPKALDLSRWVASVSVTTSEVAEVVELRGIALRASPAEFLASGFLPVLRHALEGIDLEAAPHAVVPPIPASRTESRPADELRAGVERAGAVHLHDVRGAQIGNHNLQINRFVLRGPGDVLSFDAVLRVERVKRAMRALLLQPGDLKLRADLVGELRSVGAEWTVSSRPLLLRARVASPGFFESLLAVHGVQTGNGNTQRNTFNYVVAGVPRAADLLRDNGEIACRLADYLCPPTPGAVDLGPLRSRINDAFGGLDIDWGRERNQALKFPDRGADLQVFRVDGLAVGNHNRIRSVVDVKLRVDNLGVSAPASSRVPAAVAPEIIGPESGSPVNDVPGVIPITHRHRGRTVTYPGRLDVDPSSASVGDVPGISRIAFEAAPSPVKLPHSGRRLQASEPLSRADWSGPPGPRPSSVPAPTTPPPGRPAIRPGRPSGV
jgi:hypothetical protein